MAKASVAPSKRRPVVVRSRQAAADFDLGEKPGFLFRRLDTLATILYQKHTGQNEITPRQFGVLLTLYQKGPLMQAELGRTVFADKSTLGEMLQRMIDRGLISRHVSKVDRRGVELVISDVGRRVVEPLVPAAEIAMQELIEPLPIEYRALFLKCLRLLADRSDPTT